MRKLTTTGLLAAALLFGQVSASAAGPFEDAVQAHSRGDFATALRQFRVLADRGDASAQYNLGAMYGKGEGVRRSPAEAMRLFRMAADQGNSEAQFNLGFIYETGEGVPENPVEAFKWYEKAAYNGHMGAQGALGNLYIDGRGVEKNELLGAKWHQKAADQGHGFSQLMLGVLYAEGIGLARDYAQSYKWLTLATKNLPATDRDFRETALQERGKVGGRLTAVQISRAEQEVREWKPVQTKSMVGFIAKEFTDSGELKPQRQVSGKPSQQAVREPESKEAAELRKFFSATPDDPPGIVLTWNHAAVEETREPNGSVRYVATTTNTAVEVKGAVVGGTRIVSLTVDGQETPVVGPERIFVFQRAVPIGQSWVRVKAVDDRGRVGESSIEIVRKLEPTENRYPLLNPARIKAKPRPEAVALIIGVDGYQNIPRAEFAENDARFFYDYAAGALGVPKDRIKLLTGTEARKLDVEKALLTWLKPLVAGGKSDVFVFFSGHGLASDDGRDLFLLPYDGDRSLLDRSAIRRKELVDAIVGAGATSATLFLDTCYSGGTRSGETLVASARPVLLAAKEEAVPANVTILTAAANDQLSSTLPATGHGLFSYYLMRGLEGEASGGGRSLTASDLLGYLSSRIPPEAAKLGRSQTPQVVGDGNRVISTW